MSRHRASHTGPTPFLIDARDVGINDKGVERVLVNVCRELAALAPSAYHVACTAVGRARLDPYFPSRAVHVWPVTPQVAWEQFGLPGVARRIGARAVYSHRECGALWGPPLLLHIPEDPEVRWHRNPPRSPNARARAAYSRAVLPASVRRADVAVSTRAVARQLAARLPIPAADISVIPLGVDMTRFHRTAGGGPSRYFFHLASGDARDRTPLLLAAYSLLAQAAGAPDLIIGGGVPVDVRAALVGALPPEVARRVRFTGRLSDADLVRYYSDAVAYVHLASDEGFGLQQLEALACGALPVAVPIPAVEDVVGDAVALWVSLSPEDIAVALRRAATDEELRRRAQTENPRRAATFSWRITAETIHHRLSTISNRGRQASGHAARR